MFIFPRKKVTPQLEKDVLAAVIYKYSDNGLIYEHIFFGHFGINTKSEIVLLKKIESI